MEGGKDDDGGGGVARAVAAGQERRRRWRGAGCSGDGEEESSHGSSGGGGVELSLRLGTGADDDDGGGAVTVSAATPPPPPVAPAAAEARRNMTIFYNGRVCAVDVTEVQARAIISMASEESLVDHHRPQRQQLMRGDDGDGRRRRQEGDGDSSGSSSSAAVGQRCARDRGLVRPATEGAAGVVGSPRQGGFAGGGAVAAPALEIDPAAASGLSMKRSLQLFLQKRKARTAAAVAPPYAGGGRQAQAVRR